MKISIVWIILLEAIGGITPSYAIQIVKEGGRPVLKLTREECDELLIDHVPDADVAYQEGVDVDGNSVEPADLAGSPKLDLPDIIHIPLVADLGKVRDPSDPLIQESDRILKALDDLQKGNPIKRPPHIRDRTRNRLSPLEGDVGEAGVSLKTGEVYFNGKPLSSDFTIMVRKACGSLR